MGGLGAFFEPVTISIWWIVALVVIVALGIYWLIKRKKSKK